MLEFEIVDTMAEREGRRTFVNENEAEVVAGGVFFVYFAEGRG